jgi:hypothetical protein
MSPDLIDWLRATIKGDKAAAEDLAAASWRVTSWAHERPDGGGDERIALVDDSGRKLIVFTWPDVDVTEDELEHMARHDPRDTIARCEADLMELGRHVPNFAGDCQLCDESAPCESLRINAYGLRNRPGWQEGWKP